MNLKLELVYGEISDTINDEVKKCLKEKDFDLNEIAQTKAISALSEIQEIIQNDEYDDFEAIEKIVLVFEKYKISAGTRHDF